MNGADFLSADSDALQLLAVNYFVKQLHYRYLTGTKIHHWNPLLYVFS